MINNGYDYESQIALFSATAGDVAAGTPPATPRWPTARSSRQTAQAEGTPAAPLRQPELVAG